MTNLIPYLINQGVPPQALSYLLLAPLVATLIVFLRQVVGLKTLGVYHPLLLAFAFVGLGIKEGLIVFVTIVILANLITYLVKKFSLLYLPRMTIIVTATTLGLLLIILFIRFADYPLSLNDLLPLIIILALTDKLVSAQIKRNLKPTLFLILGTLVLAIAGFYLLRVSWLQELALNYPLIFLLAVLVINVFLGRFRGLRINELWRFRRLLKLPHQ